MMMSRKFALERFRNLSEDAINTIGDESLRRRALYLRRKQGGFTLLELLVVVAILAIIGGALIASFGGQEAQASRGTATHSLAGIEDALRVYQTTQGRMPADLESLACVPYNATYNAAAYGALTVNNTASPDTAVVGEAYKFGGQSNVPGVGGGMKKKLADKFTLTAITADQAIALEDLGVTSVRYAVTAACDNDIATVDGTPMTVGSTTAALGAGELVTMDIPNHAFEDPRPATATSWENRGRGFSAPIDTAAPLMRWSPGTDDYNNKKVGAGVGDYLFALGIGQGSDLVGKANSPFAKAPFYGDVGKDKYAHYIALINVGPLGAELKEGKAFVQAVVDANGDFLDEEMAEFQGQKS